MNEFKIKAGLLLGNPANSQPVVSITDSSDFGNLPYADESTLVTVNGIKNYVETHHYTALSAGMTNVGLGPTYFDNGDDTLDVSTAKARFYDNDNFHGNLGTYTVPNAIGLSVPINTVSYLVANYNGGNPVYQTIQDKGLINESSIVPVYTVYSEDSSLYFLSWDSIGDGMTNKLHARFVKTQRFARESGLSLSESPIRNAQISGGNVWYGANNMSLADTDTATGDARFHYHVAGVWTSDSTITQYNNSQYDDGTDLRTLNNNKFTVNWVYRLISDTTTAFSIVLGDSQYGSLSSASESEPRTDLPAAFSEIALLVGRIIVEGGEDTASLIESAFETTFQTIPEIGTHNDLIGLQGGQVGEYLHLTSAEYAALGTFGTLDQIPITNTDANGYDFDPNFTFEGTNKTLKIGSIVIEGGPADDTKISSSDNTILEVTASNTILRDSKQYNYLQLGIGDFNVSQINSDQITLGQYDTLANTFLQISDPCILAPNNYILEISKPGLTLAESYLKIAKEGNIYCSSLGAVSTETQNLFYNSTTGEITIGSGPEGLYLPLSGGSLSGPLTVQTKLTVNDDGGEIAYFRNTNPSSDITMRYGYSGYGWIWKYEGSGNGNDNKHILISEGAGGADVQVYEITQDGKILYNEDNTFSKNVTIGGDLIVSGTTFSVGTETVDVSSAYIYMNTGLTIAPPTTLQSGIIVGRGTSDPFAILYDETLQQFRLGIAHWNGTQYEDASTQAAATREDNPNNNGLFYWDNTESMLVNSLNLTFDETTLYLDGSLGIGKTPTEKVDIDGNIKADSFIKLGGINTEFLKADGTSDTADDVISTVMKGIGQVTSDSTGFPNRTDSEFIIDTINAKIIIQPTGISFDVWLKGEKFTFSTPQEIDISDIEGNHFIYFDGINWVDDPEPPSVSVIKDVVFAMEAYWSVAQQKFVAITDERHGFMPWATHEYLHYTVGTAYANGLGITDVVDNGTILGVESGRIYDEDIKFDISTITSADSIPVLYRTGIGLWEKDESTSYPIRFDGDNQPNVNTFINGVWGQEKVTSNDFFCVHLFATSSPVDPVISIQGQAEYANRTLARAGALVEINSLITNGIAMAEYKSIASIIGKAKLGNTPEFEWEPVDGDGNMIIDWRSSDVGSPTSNTNVSYHNNLNGLNDGDYLHLTLAEYDAFSNAYNPTNSNKLDVDWTTNGLEVYGSTDLRGNIRILNNAGDGWLPFATRNVIGIETVMNLDNIGNVNSATGTISSSLAIGTDTATEALDVSGNIKVSGNGIFNTKVGIGIDIPVATLHVAEQADAEGIQVNGFDDYDYAWVKLNVDGGGYGQLDSNRGFRFKQNNRSIAYIDENSSNGFRVYDGIPMSFGTVGGVGRYSMGFDPNTSNLNITYNGTIIGDTYAKMSITSAGFVGIGTTVPSEKLDVSGNIISSGTITSLDIITALGGNSTDWNSSEPGFTKNTAFNKDFTVSGGANGVAITTRAGRGS